MRGSPLFNLQGSKSETLGFCTIKKYGGQSIGTARRLGYGPPQLLNENIVEQRVRRIARIIVVTVDKGERIAVATRQGYDLLHPGAVVGARIWEHGRRRACRIVP